ncbi:hypothetical protein J4Q44_G00195640 [Coregonus suidteri]|uniref:Uncharacterized protein n=2 Tax=Coregonus TaxID=27772 RepID=A0AAN8LFK7_9TELE
MPSVPSSTDTVRPVSSVCPHAAMLHNDDTNANGEAGILNGGSKVNGEAMLNDPKFSMNGSAQVNGDEVEKDLENAAAGTEERQWIRPDLPSRCTWKLGVSSAESPHCHPKR